MVRTVHKKFNAMYRSTEYLLPQSLYIQDIMPPHRKKNEHTLDNLRGKCPTIVPLLFTATASCLTGQAHAGGRRSGHFRQFFMDVARILATPIRLRILNNCITFCIGYMISTVQTRTRMDLWATSP